MDDEEEEERILLHSQTAILFSSPTRSCSIALRYSSQILFLLLLLTQYFIDRTIAQELQTVDPLFDVDGDLQTTQDWQRTTRDAIERSRCPHEAGGRSGSIVDIDLSVDHNIFTTDVLVPSIVYRVSVNPGRKVADYSLWVDGKCIIGSLDPVPSLYNYTTPNNRSQVSFKLRYRIHDDPVPYQLSVIRQISQDCELWLKPLMKGNLSSTDLNGPCLVHFQGNSQVTSSSNTVLISKAVVVTFLKLNVPCRKGALLLAPTRLCGKLEEKSPQERTLYFPHGLPQVLIEGTPVFHIIWQHVNPCYNVTLTSKNGSLEIAPTGQTSCTYRILLPYGYRVSLSLRLPSGLGESRQALTAVAPGESDFDSCQGVALELRDGSGAWFHCASSSILAGFRELQLLSTGNSVTIKVEAKPDLLAYPAMYIRYEAVGEESLVAGCPWPWLRHLSLCLQVVETAENWSSAETNCQGKGGHLASIRSQELQDLIDLMLINSPGYSKGNAYWVGATDRRIEGDFQWTDSLPFSYTNWYEGEGDVNKQPNDDGLSGQDCVELRRIYNRPPPLLPSFTDSFKWNDRSCDQANYYVCQRLASGEKMSPSLQAARWECNRTISLTLEDPRTTVTSPEFPRPYPDDVVCIITVLAPPAFTIFLEFEELVLEEEPTCSYDFVEIRAKNKTNKYCGDWSDRLKLLRKELLGPQLEIKFLSDYSYHFGGFKARISIEQTWPECGGDRLQLYNHSCYLFMSYPEVTWHTANEICRGQKGEIASVHSAAEERFIVRKIRESREYSTSAVYWLGAKTNNSTNWFWSDNTTMDFTGWVSSSKELHSSAAQAEESLTCLALQWKASPTPLLPSSLYWSAQPCDMVGGYVCKKQNPGSGRHLNFNRTVNGTEGSLTSPQYPEQYLSNLDFWVVINAPEKTRIVVIIHSLDLEHQTNCLYDYIEIIDPPYVTGGDPTKLCGHNTPDDLEKLHIVSTTNEVRIHFFSDFSIVGQGFSLSWRAVDVSGCPLHTTTAKQGVLFSPNYPHFLLSRLDCSTTILAPAGKRVWIEIVDYESSEPILEVDLGGGEGRLTPYSSLTLLSDGVYVSSGERMQVTLRTGDNPVGRGYKVVYKAVGDIKEDRAVDLGHRTWGRLLHVNFPSGPPRRVDVTHKLVVPLGNTLHLQFNKPSETNDNGVQETGCNDDNTIEVMDWYSDSNGTVWRLCAEDIESQLTIDSWLNTLKVRTVYGVQSGPNINITVTVKPDPTYKTKLLPRTMEPYVEACDPSPCQNKGKCVTGSVTGKHSCQCNGHYTGMMCGLTLCDLNPCLFGECELAANSFRCICKPGYQGKTCEERIRPCSTNPCNSHGECTETSDANFKCRCYAWWNGATCLEKLPFIPYKPLSERMLQEPFWLGLITVTVVLAVLGLFWCAKRHFPEKLEKLLQEENERNRPYISNRHCPSVRERTLAVSATRDSLALAASGGSSGGSGSGGRSGAEPKTLLGRLGIRKPSLLSTPSLQPPAAHFHSRTFSLDDLITGSTSPGPRKKRNNSTPTKKSSVSEKKQILQQLVSPALATGESIPLSSNSLSVEPSTSSAETSFSSKLTPDQTLKLEKKVTFARLLDKVNSEMSSGSEIEVGGPRGTSASADQLIRRPTLTAKSPNSTSSNQGSDSRSSSETHLSIVVGDVPSRAGRKTASADSILAMFRNFAAVSAGGMSPSPTTPTTTPTGSSTRDDAAGSDDSSGNNTPTSSSSFLIDSPMFAKKNQIQVSVLDPLSAQKSQNSLLQPPSILLEVSNKCLSPIREMPTPMPSPAITPILPRHNQSSFLSPSINNKSNGTLSPGNPFRLTLDLPIQKDTLPIPPANLVIPVLRIEEASPTTVGTFGPQLICPGSPPPIPRSRVPQLYSPPHHKPLLKDLDKPNSLELPCPPPLITVTCSMTEGESDGDSPALSQLGPGNTGPGMCYLSPFSICGRNDRTTSESNLSSSGYSSMASPGPSRCGSNNPLCPTDTEDHLHSIMRRPSPLTRAPSEDSDPLGGSNSKMSGHHFPSNRPRSDSETLSDELQLESNDEGFGTDQLDEKIEDGDVKSAKELEVFIDDSSRSVSPNVTVKHCSSFETGLEACKIKSSKVKHCASVEAGLDCYRMMPSLAKHSVSAEDALDTKRSRVSLQLPSILVEGEPHCEKRVSPVSSRSESPLSDKTGITRFSPMFYGRMTDSDGIYDCGSSADLGAKSSKRHSAGRRKERKRSKSPTRVSQTLLEVPNVKSMSLDPIGSSNRSAFSSVGSLARNKPSPKRRARPIPVSSSSSSSAESLISIRDVTSVLAQEKYLGGDHHWSPIDHLRTGNQDDSTDETEDVTTKMLPEADQGSRVQRKISRMRAIGHQIRFLRRLEQSLKRSKGYQKQERLSSPERPLLQQEDAEASSKRIEKRRSWLKQRSGAVSDCSGPTEWTALSPSHRSGYTD